MFKLAMVRQVEWPVTVSIPQDGGGTVKSTFTATFKVLDQDAQDKLLEQRGDLVNESLIGWKGVADEDEREVPFTEEQKAKLLKISYVRSALLNAWLDCHNGKAAARKN